MLCILRYENDKKGDYLFNIDILNSNGDIIAIFSQLWIRVMPMQKYKKNSPIKVKTIKRKSN